VNHTAFTLQLPDWLQKVMSQANHSFGTIEDRMNFIISLSRLNVRHKTGGPFAAAIFSSEDGSLTAAGVNLVLSGKCSVLHAEIVITMEAERKAGTHNLGSSDLPPYELETSVTLPDALAALNRFCLLNYAIDTKTTVTRRK
jgi:hypothetical protein